VNTCTPGWIVAVAADAQAEAEAGRRAVAASAARMARTLDIPLLLMVVLVSRLCSFSAPPIRGAHRIAGSYPKLLSSNLQN
jgi:hypothetical protein